MSKQKRAKLTILVAFLAMLLGMAVLANAQPAPAPAPVMTAPAPTMAPAPVVMAPAPAPVVMAPAPMVATVAAPVTMAPVAAAPAVMAAAAPAPAAPTEPAMASAEPVESVDNGPAIDAPQPTQPTMEAAPATPPAAAPAAPKQDSKGSVVGGWALQMLLYLLGIAVTALTPVLTAWIWKRFKLDKVAEKDKIDEMVLKAALFGIGKANEAAYKLRDNPMKSAEKLDLAVKKANDYLRDSGLPEKGAEYLADLIESQLGLTRDTSAIPKAEDKPKEDK